MRQHTLGPYPLDPNLLAQGVPPDDRITGNDRIFGPVQGTPLPPGAVPRGAPAGPRGENPPPGTVGAAVPPVPSSGPTLAPFSRMSAELSPIAPLDVPSAGELPAQPPPPPAPAPQDQVVDGGRPQAAPSSFGAKASKPAPSVVVAKYDPHTGRYVGPDGKLYEQSDLATSKAPKTWRDMLPT
jgi:phospholipid/cholesterol/gamma-HCH transport system substrate-binding protein